MGKKHIKKLGSPTLSLWFFSIVWLGFYGFLMLPKHLLIFTGTQTPGIVTDVRVHEDNEDGDTYEPKVEYTCEGLTTEQRQGYSSSSHYRVGKKVTVFCDKNNPTKFIIKSFSNYMTFVFPLIGLLVLYFSIKSLYKDIKRRRLKNKLSQYGIHIAATISEIKDTKARMNNVPGYKIVANCDGKIFTSETIYAKLEYILKEGDKIDVYVDPINSNDYRMDTDSIFDRPIREDYSINNPNKLNNTEQNIFQNSTVNLQNAKNENVVSNANIIHPRPPKISDKKCPIHKAKTKIGYGLGIIFSLIGGGIITIFLINAVELINNEGLISVFELWPILLFGIIFLSIGLITIIPDIKINKKKKRLMAGGVKKEGMVTEISRDNTRINNQSGYVITAIYDGKLFKSEAVYADIYYLVEEGDEIDIYLGDGGDDDYRVDIDNLFYREPKPSYYERPHGIGDIFNIIKETIINNKTN